MPRCWPDSRPVQQFISRSITERLTLLPSPAVDAYFQEIRVKFDQYFAAHSGVNYKIGVYGPGTILPTVMNDPNVGASYSWVADPFRGPYAKANLEQTQDAVPTAGMRVGPRHCTLGRIWAVGERLRLTSAQVLAVCLLLLLAPPERPPASSSVA